MDPNTLHDPQIPPDAKTHVRRNVSWRTFSSNCTLTRARKIVHRRFMPQMHQNVLHDMRIPPDAKIEVWLNVS
jgi:hypothetical protein